MEQYMISTLPRIIKMGKYKDIIYAKHATSYGNDGADDILITAKSILYKSLRQYDNSLENNNVLLVGMVQSGKTSNLEMLTALSFDNDYNTLIIYGGYDNDLLKQCVDRFSDTFDSDDIIILSTDNSNLETYDRLYFDNKIDDKKKFIICAMKRPDALNKVNDCLKRLKGSKIKPFIIDDEGDQASLNTKIFKEQASATYKSILEMKKITNNPLYYAVTATPQANVFQPDISELKPNSLHLIKPGNGYIGGSYFHLNNIHIHLINDNDNNDLENNGYPDSLRNAFYHFIIASAIMRIRNIKYSDMIVHVFREIEGHSKIYNRITDQLNDIKECYNNSDKESQKYHLDKMKKIYDDPQYFSDNIRLLYKWDYTMEINIKRVISSCLVIEQNSKNRLSAEDIKSYNHRIYIGGDLLQRGITFKNLVTTYFTRWADKGNMDTSLQRARWFGYREKIIDITKLFITNKIMKEFSNLASIEEDLWEQFRMVENGELELNEIIIDANDTSLRPTRKNVAQYKKTKFASNWSNQRTIVNDVNDIDFNNKIFEDLIRNACFNSSTIGRYDNRPSTYYTNDITCRNFIEFIKNSKNIFNNNPFSNSELIKVLEENINLTIQLMTSYNDLIEYRTRTVEEGNVTYLKQGPSYNGDKRYYEGDSSVIVDTQTATIQVFKIIPVINNEEKTNMAQYMFSFHFPNKRIVYAKK